MLQTKWALFTETKPCQIVPAFKSLRAPSYSGSTFFWIIRELNGLSLYSRPIYLSVPERRISNTSTYKLHLQIYTSQTRAFWHGNWFHCMLYFPNTIGEIRMQCFSKTFKRQRYLRESLRSLTISCLSDKPQLWIFNSYKKQGPQHKHRSKQELYVLPLERERKLKHIR